MHRRRHLQSRHGRAPPGAGRCDRGAKNGTGADRAGRGLCEDSSRRPTRYRPRGRGRSPCRRLQDDRPLGHQPPALRRGRRGWSGACFGLCGSNDPERRRIEKSGLHKALAGKIFGLLDLRGTGALCGGHRISGKKRDLCRADHGPLGCVRGAEGEVGERRLRVTEDARAFLCPGRSPAHLARSLLPCFRSPSGSRAGTGSGHRQSLLDLWDLSGKRAPGGLPTTARIPPTTGESRRPRSHGDGRACRDTRGQSAPRDGISGRSGSQPDAGPSGSDQSGG